jgi:hypothetical protein
MAFAAVKQRGYDLRYIHHFIVKQWPFVICYATFVPGYKGATAAVHNTEVFEHENCMTTVCTTDQLTEFEIIFW